MLIADLNIYDDVYLQERTKTERMLYSTNITYAHKKILYVFFNDNKDGRKN